MTSSYGVLCVWPITETAPGDVIGQAHEQLAQTAATAQARILPGPTRWIVLDADDLEGWKDWRAWDLAVLDETLGGWAGWTGQLLAVVAPAEPIADVQGHW